MNDYIVEIVLVEDSPSDAELTIRALKKNNITNHILHLKDGEAALDYFFGTGKYKDRDLKQKPKVVLLDLKMPKVNGIQVLELLKANDLTVNIPIVVLTSSKEDPDIQRCYELGTNSYIVKPVDFDAFIKVVTQLGMYWTILNQPPK
ncbi:MAG TPA: two-component system response regulator [Cytophagales bacterium]|jgi:two-component system, response regulator|nr:two-component system response regulator [Cytophagales bacterium]